MDDMKDFCGTGVPLDPEPAAPMGQPEVTEPASDGSGEGPWTRPTHEDAHDDGPWGGEPWEPDGAASGRGWRETAAAGEVDDGDWDDAA